MRKAELARKHEPIQKLEDEKIEILKSIKPKVITSAYDFFEKKSHDALVYVFEALVGMMRDQKYADNKSVELYLKKFEGFMLALNRLELANVNPAYAKEY